MFIEILLHQGFRGEGRSPGDNFNALTLEELPGRLAHAGGDNVGNPLPVEPGRENARLEIRGRGLYLVDNVIILDGDKRELPALAELFGKLAILNRYGKF